MPTTLPSEQTQSVLDRLRAANRAFAEVYPGPSDARQPVHTVYGGAHLFRADTAVRMGQVALRHLAAYAPTFVDFARVFGFPGSEHLPASDDEQLVLRARLETDPEAVRREHEEAWLAHRVYRRVLDKLEREAVEDFRIDFEDGYGNRPDAEEDAEAARTAEEVARGMDAGTLPPFLGIRIKPFSDELARRAVRTLDLFVTTLAARTGGRLPEGFVVTLPKVTMPEQVAALVELFERLEAHAGLAPESLRVELMVETPQAILQRDGRSALPAMVAAARGRCRGAHFGVYDYTASCDVTAAHQHMTHPACDFARHVMQVVLMGTGVWLSDGATNIMPVGPHRAAPDGPPLSALQERENRAVVHRAWKLAYDDTRHALRHGFYQGWDLHPAQLAPRYAAVYAFFLEGLEAASERLKAFMDKAAQATLVGDVFDDAATGQALLNYFLRAINCGAISEDEAAVTGLTLDEIRTRSFYRILENRRQKTAKA